MSLLMSLLVLLVCSRIFGEVFRKFNQPTLLGEIFAGILLGPAILGLVKLSPALAGISELAVFFIILSAGLEMEFKDILKAFKGRGLIVAFLGFALPFAAGYAVGQFFELDGLRCIFLGLCIAITALPVAVRILNSFNMLKSDIAHYAIAAAIINDVVALLALGVIIAMPSQASTTGVWLSLGTGILKFLLFGALVISFNFLLEKAESRGFRVDWPLEKLVQLMGKETLLGIVIVFVLMFSMVTEVLGLQSVIGAFFGALLLDRKLFLRGRYKEFENSLNSITSGFLSPIFFASLGLEFDIKALTGAGFVTCVLAISVLSKVFAGYLGGKIVQMSNRDAFGLGIILNGRGIMELVVANIALQHNFIGPSLFSTLVLMGVFTTLLTPMLFRSFVYRPSSTKTG